MITYSGLIPDPNIPFLLHFTSFLHSSKFRNELPSFAGYLIFLMLLEAISASIKTCTVTCDQGGANPTFGGLKRLYVCIATLLLSDVLLFENIN